MSTTSDHARDPKRADTTSSSDSSSSSTADDTDCTAALNLASLSLASPEPADRAAPAHAPRAPLTPDELAFLDEVCEHMRTTLPPEELRDIEELCAQAQRDAMFELDIYEDFLLYLYQLDGEPLPDDPAARWALAKRLVGNQ